MTTTNPPTIERIAEFTFMWQTEVVVLRQEPDGTWKMTYCRVNGHEQAFTSGLKSRAAAIRAVKRFMIGHGQCLIENLIQSAEARHA
jgi:hypothetical protein